MIYLVDSAGARITDQIEMFPDAAAPKATTGADERFCSNLLLFGPSAAGGAYIPFLRYRRNGRRQRIDVLGSPRMAEMVIGER